MSQALRRLIALFCSLTISLLPASAFDAADSSSELGLDILRQLSASDSGNLLLSPHSLSSVLAPLYLGSAGETRSELARVVRFPNQDALVEKAFADLRRKLTPPKTPDSKVGQLDRPGVTFHSANRLFIQKGFPIREVFNDRLRASFDFVPQALDFRQKSSESAATINTWVSEQTHEKITSVLPSQLPPETRIILINALYFHADWQEPFKSEQTFPRPFHLNGSTATSDRSIMQRTARMGYAHEDGFQVVSLPYVDGDYHCLIILPDELSDSMDAASRVTAQQLKRWSRLARRDETLVDLQLPAFSFANTARSLAASLKQLGVRQAFDEPKGSANFDPISPRTGDDYLAVSDVLQSTFIAVDENGTEAAAATAIEMITLSASAGPRPKPIEMHVNRPFLFAIQHQSTGACLFLGRVVDPQKK
jgi:serpin B